MRLTVHLENLHGRRAAGRLLRRAVRKEGVHHRPGHVGMAHAPARPAVYVMPLLVIPADRHEGLIKSIHPRRIPGARR
jgi:hypothetical protein